MPIDGYRATGDAVISGSSSAAEAVGLSIIAIYLLILILIFWAYIRIIRRAGYSGWWILIGLVPLVNLVMLLIFAFKEWPIQRELTQLRAMTGQSGYRTGPPAVAGGYPTEDYGNRSRFGSAWPDQQPR